MLIDALLERIFSEVAETRDGAVADYIPELGKADPESFAIALTTADGQTYAIGDAGLEYTIQSVSKPFMYGLALHEFGAEAVLKKVGVEPTGESFNSIVLDEVNSRPFNPMVNAGAIAVAALVAGETRNDREARMLKLFSDFAGRPLGIDEAVYRSEDATGHRNRAIAYMMLNAGMIAGDPSDILDLYFRQCSIGVTSRDLSVMAAALANDGVNPLTGRRILGSADTRDVLTVMQSCGMYNYAGQWAFEVGMPAKSGVSGAVIAVLPGQLGICAFSPRLDGFGNSIRGVRVCQRLSEELGLHLLSNRPAVQQVVRRAYRGGEVLSKRRRTLREIARLERTGRTVLVVELQGALFFGTAERLIRHLSGLADELDYIILDFHRVTGADSAAQQLIGFLCGELSGRLKRLLCTGIDERRAPPALRESLEGLAGNDLLDLRADTDAALEWCENRLLAGDPDKADRTRFALSRLSVFAGLDAGQCRRIEDVIQPLQFEAGETIMREGDAARMLFIIARGSVTVSVGTETGRRKRLACIGPGLSFGEMALLDGSPRSADVTADETVVCYGLSRQALEMLGRSDPAILITILQNLMNDLSNRLRQANTEIRTLE